MKNDDLHVFLYVCLHRRIYHDNENRTTC